MRKFAELTEDRKFVKHKFTSPFVPRFPDNVKVIEITGMVPEPEEGDSWDGKKFSAQIKAEKQLQEDMIFATDENAKIQAQIEEIEKKQSRAIREYVLYGTKSYLEEIDSEIKKLRNKFIVVDTLSSDKKVKK